MTLATYIGSQDLPSGGKIALFNLQVDIPGHPKGSTVSGQTLLAYLQGKV